MKQFLTSPLPVTAHTDYVGPGSTFVAISGFTNNGMGYIPVALAKGARCIVVQHDEQVPAVIVQAIQQAGADLLMVPNARKALAEFCAQAHDWPASRLKIIGITGTKGKTTTACACAHMLKTAGKKVALISTVYNEINGMQYAPALTTPQPDYLHAFLKQAVHQGVQYVVMEVSAQALSLHRLYGMSFDVTLFTNFSQEHGEFYETSADYFAAKTQLFEMVKPNGLTFINADDLCGQQLLQQYPDADSFSCSDPEANYYARLIKTDVASMEFALVRAKQTLEFGASLGGAYNLANILGAIAIADRLDIDLFQIYQAVATIPTLPGRMERYDLSNGAQCIIDYAHNAASFEAFLSHIRPFTNHLIVLFGAAGGKDQAKRSAMGAAAARYADAIILSSDNPGDEDPEKIIQDILRGIPQQKPQQVVCEPDRKKAIQLAYAQSGAGSIIVLLAKGPDEYQIMEGVRMPFSEREIVQGL